MTTCVALLRAINLAGRRRVPMADLRSLAAELGFEDPQTHLQSGNLVFAASESETEVTESLERALLERFGFEIPVIVRTGAEMAAVAARHPFQTDEQDPAKLHVVFFPTPPAADIIAALPADRWAPDRFTVDGREAYIHYPEGAGRSKLDLSPLGPGTARNWRTVQALATMAAP